MNATERTPQPPPRRNLWLFVAAVVMTGAASGLYETVFNNYLDHTFQIGADLRGRLEFPRELPGFLTVLFAGLLFFVPETWIGVLAALSIALGMIGLAEWGTSWTPMLGFLVLWSCGSHLSMPVRSSLGLALARKEAQGRRLGQIAGAGTAATVIGCGLEVSINHIVSMSIPTLGGLAWMRWGHASVFLGAAVVALLMLFFTSRIRVPAASPEA